MFFLCACARTWLNACVFLLCSSFRPCCEMIVRVFVCPFCLLYLYFFMFVPVRISVCSFVCICAHVFASSCVCVCVGGGHVFVGVR